MMPPSAQAGNGGGDAELERLKARRLAEMRKNVQRGQQGRADAAQDGERPRPTPREALLASLGHRGAEVLEAAERQYPAHAPAIANQLGIMVMDGELPGGLDGGWLLAVFRSVGINVRLQTKIKVEQDGKMVSLAERLGGGKGAGM